ncbi:MAG: leucyl aminopeptidase family protein [Alphaproteobacteria bacterium]
MKADPFKFPAPFLAAKKSRNIEIIPLHAKEFPAWLKKQPARLRARIRDNGFAAQSGQCLLIANESGAVTSVIAGVTEPAALQDMGAVIQFLQKTFAANILKTSSFTFNGFAKKDLETHTIGWGLGCYYFGLYKKDILQMPSLVWPAGADKKRIKAVTDSIFLLKNMVNMPSNDMGPAEMESAVRKLATPHKAKVSVVKGAELAKNFPLIHMVGDGSERRPRLIELNWGNPKNPKLTLVGKGVAFDTGGLNIKPGPSMALMKKDMGGAAHALALAHIIMVMMLPVRLRVLIASVENSISGRAFRPGDIMTSRKGITVENTNTDAEGRLILADTLTYACENRPDLIIDFATLTGSARAGLGPDIPPVFSTAPKLAEKLKDISFKIDDPVWPMPLWEPYKKYNCSTVATLHNSSGVPGDLMYSALFLKEFITPDQDWMHLDVYAWEHSGRPGRPAGAADTGVRAVFALLEEKYK